MEFLLPGNCPASLRPTAAHLWKTFRSKLNAIPVDEQNCSPSHRNHVHFQTGMLFGITTEWCSASDRNRVHLRPDSPVNPRTAILTGGSTPHKRFARRHTVNPRNRQAMQVDKTSPTFKKRPL